MLDGRRPAACQHRSWLTPANIVRRKSNNAKDPDYGDSRIHGGGSEAARGINPSVRRIRLWQPCITRREMTLDRLSQR
jgi:hypothetical protein